MDVLDIFYNHVIQEAATGRVVCDLFYNVLFETYFSESDKRIECTRKFEGVIIPVLTIKDKALFDKLLVQYVKLCKKFDDVSYYQLDDLTKEEKEKYRICEEKMILTLLWSNATFEDFQDPINFLHKRIAFLENDLTSNRMVTDYSQMLSSYIKIKIEKDNQETPYVMAIKLVSDDNDHFNFPEVSFAIQGDTVYIYAIQNSPSESNSFTKKINRILYKIGEDFDETKDNYDIYKEGNLKDVTPSFVVALNIAISYFNSLGYTKFCAPSILITRWNAKKIATQYMSETGYIDEKKKEELFLEQDRIQHNLTEKFLRTFLRLANHYDEITIDSYPFIGDSSLHISVSGPLITTNRLLQETSDLVRMNTKNKKI